MFSGASAVNTGVLTYYPKRAPGCGCIGHPAFPAPLFQRATGSDKSRARRAAERFRMCVDARHYTVVRRVGKAPGARECARRLRAHHSMQAVGTARDAPLPTLRHCDSSGDI